MYGCRYPIRICPNIVSGPLLYPSTRFGVSPIGDERVREGKIGLSCNGVVEVTSPKGTKSVYMRVSSEVGKSVLREERGNYV